MFKRKIIEEAQICSVVLSEHVTNQAELSPMRASGVEKSIIRQC